MKTFAKVKSLVASLEVDADKFFNRANNAAGTRLRKGMQELKTLAQELRTQVQNQKNKELVKK